MWCWRRPLSIPWTAGRSNQSILKEISPEYSLEGLMLKLKLQYFGHLMWSADSLEKTDAERDWGQEEKGTTEDEMAGWHHRLDGRKFEWTPGVGDGQGGLACWDSWGHRESDTAERLNWTDIDYIEGGQYVTYLHTHIYTLEKEMATHSTIPAWKIPETEEPSGLPSMGLHRVRHDCAYVFSVVFCSYIHPLHMIVFQQYSLLPLPLGDPTPHLFIFNLQLYIELTFRSVLSALPPHPRASNPHIQFLLGHLHLGVQQAPQI